MKENEEEVNKVGHYRSWYEVATKLTDPKDRLAFYDALDAYRFEGIEIKNLPPVVDILLTAIKPSIDADINCRLTGASGGTKKGVSGKAKKGVSRAENTPLEEKDEPPYTENGNTPSEIAQRVLEEDDEAPYVEKEKGDDYGATDTGVKNENTPLNTPLFEKKYPPISNSDSKEEVEEEVEVEEDDDEEDARAEAVTRSAVENWLNDHELTLPDKDSKRITVSLITRQLDKDYLDYALKYVSSKSYKSRDGTGNIRFSEIPEGNRKGLFIDAVINWQDMTQGYKSWHEDRIQKENLCPVQKTPPKPLKCPMCGEPLYEGSGESMCIKCKGYLEWGGRGWRISPFPTGTIAEGVRQMRA